MYYKNIALDDVDEKKHVLKNSSLENEMKKTCIMHIALDDVDEKTCIKKNSLENVKKSMYLMMQMKKTCIIKTLHLMMQMKKHVLKKHLT